MATTAKVTGLLATLLFAKEKETKGAVRYTEVKPNDLDEAVVGTLYVRKSAFKGNGTIPDQLELTISIKQGRK